MDYLVIVVVACLASGATLFSGFGLGTVLTPAFALFFPLPAAIAATAIVHLANNLFKLALTWRNADWGVAARFALPAALAALLGAGALVLFARLPALGGYEMFGARHEITWLKLVIGVLIIAFALLEFSDGFSRLALPPKYLVLGGVLSGFFGGLSGNQGAFRSAFLLKVGLKKKAFVATGVISAVVVDSVRLSIYGLSWLTDNLAALPGGMTGLVVAATLAAFLGAYVGNKLLARATMEFIRVAVAIAMIAIGAGLAAGIV